jgi:glycosyltransferase involved in cell wall biosynthesis
MPHEPESYLKEVLKHSLSITSLRELQEIDYQFRKIAESRRKSLAWFYYNEFRIANIARFPKTRPHILLGGHVNIKYPNIHSIALFEAADVVCISSYEKDTGYSLRHCKKSTLFYDILKSLPTGFKPDFYWDNQVEHQHFIPPGIETAPFPIIASVCHSFLHKSIEHICELFDLVITMSESHKTLLQKKYGKKIIKLPFGINWGSLDFFIAPSWDKAIDVCVTFGSSDCPSYANKRNLILEELKKFKEKYGDRFSILFASDFSKNDYVRLLNSSRIAINATGVHGPYNYRTIESMCAGAMVFQYDWKGDFFENKFSESFVDGVHGVGFTLGDLEKKLLYYLENKNQIESIAKKAYEYITANYSYKKLYPKLIEAVKDLPKTAGPSSRRVTNGFHHIDMVYYSQGNNEALSAMNYGPANVRTMPDWIQFNNLMIYLSIFKDDRPGYSLLLVEIFHKIPFLKYLNHWDLICELYSKGKDAAPEEMAWFIQWNFFLISVEQKKAGKEEMQNILTVLQNAKPTPFDEQLAIFKYYLSGKDGKYPLYTFLTKNITSVPWLKFNLDLIKTSDNPMARALLYREYALEFAKYIYHSS